jgi:hypothetical protein
MERNHRFKRLNRNRSLRDCSHAIEKSSFFGAAGGLNRRMSAHLLNQKVKP